MGFISVILLLLGIGLLCLVCYQSTLTLVTTLRQFRTDREQRELGIELLHNKIAAMKALFLEQASAKNATWSGFRKFRVKTKKEASDVTSTYLYPHDGKTLPPFKPGQYLTFQLKVPGEPKPLIRCYSLSEGINSEFYRVSVKKVPPPRDRPELPSGKSSTFFNDVLKDEDILDVKAPSGAFFLETREQYPIVLIGGGIGVTPVYSMLRTMVTEDSDREVWFFYGVRNGKEVLYREELKEIARTQPNVRLQLCFSDPLPEDRPGEDFHQGERVSVELFKRLLPSNNYEFYICGPPPMMNSLVPDLEGWGVPEAKVRYEAFGPATVKKAKKKEDETQAAPAATVNVKFRQSSKELGWNGQCDSVLELAEKNGISMSSGCRVGNCGTCMVVVKEGSVKYANQPSFTPDPGTCLACVAMPQTNIEIDA